MKLLANTPRNKIIFFVGLWVSLLALWQFWPPYYSEDDFLSLPISHPVYGGEWAVDFYSKVAFSDIETLSKVTQRERLHYLHGAIEAAIKVLNKAGLQAFIEAGTLLGWYRHNGKPIPWDTDADVGIIGEECRKKYPNQKELLEFLRREVEPKYYHIEFFSCNYPHDHNYNNRFSGMVVDTRTGFKADIFSYNPVDTTHDTFTWRNHTEWLMRDDERNRHWRVTPRDAVLPLQYGNYSGITGNIIVNKPRERLQWDYGMVLESHVFPYRLNLETSMSAMTAVMVAILLVLYTDYLLIGTIVVTGILFAGGIRIALFILLLAIGIVLNRKQSTLLLTITVISALTLDLSPVIQQVFEQTMEILGVLGYRVNPGRFCFLHENVFCIDY